MSLVIARQIGNDIFLVGDTKLTSKKGETLNIIQEGNVLKIVIIHPQCVFAFAGGEDDAEEALKEIKPEYTFDQIKSIVYSAHKNSFRDNKYGVEFILAFGKPNYEIIEYKNGDETKRVVAWIGTGNEIFLNYMHGVKDAVEQNAKPEKTHSKSRPQNANVKTAATIKISGGEFLAIAQPTNKKNLNKDFTNAYSLALDSMKQLIESGRVNEVGGFYTPVAYHENEFQYMHYSTVFGSEQIIEIPVGAHSYSVPLSFGTPQEGSYIVTLMQFANQSKEKVAAFHFMHGELGIIYKRIDNGLPRPITFNKDAIDFAFALKEELHLKELPGLPIGIALDRFGKKASDCVKSKNYEKALEIYNWGIESCKRDKDVWKLYSGRAHIFFQMKKYHSVLNDLNSIFETVPENGQEEYFNSRGLGFAHLKKDALAIDNFDKTLRINPNRPATFYNRSLCHYKLAVSNSSREMLSLSKSDLEKAKNLGYKKEHVQSLEKMIGEFEKKIR